MPPEPANENTAYLSLLGQPPPGGHLHVIGIAGLLELLPETRTDRERFLSMLRSRPFVTHADAIEALWGKHENGGPLYAQHILAIYVSRLRRSGYVIENYRGIGYRFGGVLSEPAVD